MWRRAQVNKYIKPREADAPPNAAVNRRAVTFEDKMQADCASGSTACQALPLILEVLICEKILRGISAAAFSSLFSFRRYPPARKGLPHSQPLIIPT
jgi:hypothetical protein